MKTIDAWLNTITMYRLAVYYLIALLAVAIALSFARILSFDPFALLFAAGFLVAVCWISNALLARVFRIPANVESSYITALILALIVSPITGYADLPYLAWMGILAMASKYIIAPFGKHIFNPVGISVAVMGLAASTQNGRLFRRKGSPENIGHQREAELEHPSVDQALRGRLLHVRAREARHAQEGERSDQHR